MASLPFPLFHLDQSQYSPIITFFCAFANHFKTLHTPLTQNAMKPKTP